MCGNKQIGYDGENEITQIRQAKNVLLRPAGRERRESRHEEVETRERDHVHRDLAKIRVELTGEAQAARHAGERSADEMVQISVGRRRELQRPETDVVQGLVIHHHDLAGKKQRHSTHTNSTNDLPTLHHSMRGCLEAELSRNVRGIKPIPQNSTVTSSGNREI